MKTTIWLKSQPNKKIEYPDCLPTIYNANETCWMTRIDDAILASYEVNSISRIEYRPS